MLQQISQSAGCLLPKNMGGTVLHHHLKNIYLSQREFQCLILIVRGRSSKEIGRILQISSRTVEVHVYNMKIKLGCTKKSQLIDVALNNQVDIYFNNIENPG